MALPDKELLLDAVKGGVLTLALFLSYISFPVIGLLPGIFTPLPAIYYYCKRGAIAGFAVPIITFAALAVMGGFAVPLLYLMQAGIISLLLPWYYMQGKATAKVVAYPVCISFLLIILLGIAYGIWSGTDLQAMLLKGVTSSSEQAIAIYSKQNIPAEDLEMVTKGISQAGELVAHLFPALLLVAMGSIAALNMISFFRLARKWLPDLPQPDNFQTFRNPDAFVWVVIVAGFSMLLPQQELQRAALNLLTVAGFIYFLQGLAVTLAFFQRIAVPPLARVIFWLALIFQPYLFAVLTILGLFDTWADFRTPKQKNL